MQRANTNFCRIKLTDQYFYQCVRYFAFDKLVANSEPADFIKRGAGIQQTYMGVMITFYYYTS